MRPASVAHLALAAVLVVAAGCSGNKVKIQETKWVSQAATVQGEELAAGARQLQFGRDGHLVYVVGDRPYKGGYSLGIGSAVTFTLDQELDGRKIHPHRMVIDGDLLTLTSADGSELTFQKAK